MPQQVIIKRALLFLAGLFLLDQAVLRVGDSLVDSPYWGDPVIYGISAGKPRSAYILGTCRAALVLDPAILEAATNREFFNAGRVVDGLGNMDFTLGVIMSHVHPKLIAIVLDTELLMETQQEARADLGHREIWWSALDHEHQRDLLHRYHYASVFLYSGFWMFRGTGIAMLKAIVRRAMRRGVPPKDAYEPYPVEPNLGSGNLHEPILRLHTRQSAELTDFSKEVIARMVDQVLQRGAIPIIVVPPMHRLYASDQVNEQTLGVIREIADARHVKVFDHLRDTRFSGHDSLWTNTSHLNQAGAEEFSRLLASELKAAIP